MNVRYNQSDRTVVRPGLTLIDVVITTLIIGIMAAVATPKFTQFYETERLRTVSQRLITDLRLIQSWAATTSTTQTVTFSLAPSGYTVTGGLMNPHRPNEPFKTNLREYPYLATLTSADFDGDQVLIFNGLGQPDSSGSLVISSGVQSQTIVVNAVTGKAAVQ